MNGLGGRSLILALTVLLSSIGCIAKTKAERLPFTSPVLPGYNDTDSIERRIIDRGPHRIEGIWQFQADGSSIVIEREERLEGLSYRMVVLRSSNRLLRPGTLIGNLIPTGKSDVYDASIYSTDADGGKLRLPKNYLLTLGEGESRLIFKKQKSKYAVNLWRLIPYMWRGVIRVRPTGDESQEGCVKIFPNPDKPVEPRYL